MTITGESLALEKCHNILLKYNFNTFMYHEGPKFLGLPKFLRSSELREECVIRTTDGNLVEIKTVELDKGQQLLRMRLVENGGFKDEYIHSKPVKWQADYQIRWPPLKKHL